MKRRGGIRAFIALGMPEAAREALERLQGFLPGERLTAPETFHLTLAFLDTRPEAVIADIHERLLGIQAEPVTLALRGVELYGTGRRAIVWARAAPDPSLADLHGKVRRAVMDAGVHLGRDRFRPHVTLARIGASTDGRGKSEVADFVARHSAFVLEPFTISGFRLYRSTLDDMGAVYDMLWEYPLGKRVHTA